MAHKIAIVGAARRHQGTGPFVARTFAKFGHEICGVVGTSATSLDETVSMLSNQYDIRTRGYLTLDTLLEEQAVDVLAVCSPADSHLQYLQQALTNSLHVFCEKPLWWPANSSTDFTYTQYEAEISQLIELAKQNRRNIHINTQWPYTLRDFYAMHPAALGASGEVRQFAMHLCPQSRGSQMLVDAASHGLSMLYQLTGNGDLREIVIDKLSVSDGTQLTIHFKYVHAKGTTKVTFGLTNSQETPKPASYQINGITVNRLVELPSYQIQLQSNASTVNVADPLEISILDFIANIEAELECDETALMLGAQHLYSLIEACR